MSANETRSEKSVRIVLDEEKILREGKYKLEDLYAYLDEIAKEADLIKQDKYNYVGKGDKNDLSRLGIFTNNNVVKNEAITRNVKEWYWLENDEIDTNVIESAKRYDKGIWE
ncbi:hypothetical protein ACWIWK_05220 [Helicobacter sp. 23-1048]